MEVEESLFQDGSVFPLLFLRREEDARIEEGEVCSLHLLIAAFGLHRPGLVVLSLGCCSSLLPQLPLSLCDFFSGGFLEQKLPRPLPSSSLLLALPPVS